MSDFKAIMHQIQFWLGLHLRHFWETCSAPPDPLAEFKGSTSKVLKGGEGKEGAEGGDGSPLLFSADLRPCESVTHTIMYNAQKLTASQLRYRTYMKQKKINKITTCCCWLCKVTELSREIKYS